MKRRIDSECKSRILHNPMLMSRILSIFLALVITASNLLSADPGPTDISIRAEVAARRDLGFPSWKTACKTVCLFGFRESALRVPPPPAERFIGKSSSFIAAYSLSYKRESRAIRHRYTGLSCCAGFVMGVTVTACLVAMNWESYKTMDDR